MQEISLQFTPTEIMRDFGIKSKFCQKPKEDDKEFPYWASTHHYDDSSTTWGKIRIPIQPFSQSGVKHYFGSIELGIADAICRVPALASSTDSMEICRRTLQNEVTEQYQRPLNFDRINNINDFYSDNPTIVNPIIFDLPEKSKNAGSVKIISDSDNSYFLEIDLQKIRFISQQLKDYDEGKHIDHRPVDLVDGQHRVRSSKLNLNALGLSIPFILINPEFEGGGGRIFAEINVQNEPLDDLHQLHLRYVLSLSSHKDSDDFGTYDESFYEDRKLSTNEEYETHKNRFANRLAYRVGARLNLNDKSPLYGLIRYYGPKNKAPIPANTWVTICKEWAIKNLNLATDEEKFVKCIQAYFEAWKRISNTDPRTGKFYEDWRQNNRWGEFINPKTESITQSKLHTKLWFGQIMKLFPQCYTLGNIKNLEKEIEIEERFFKLLTPCLAIDGTDVDAWEIISRQSNRLNHKEDHVYHWMSWAIHEYALTGATYDPSEVWNISNSNIKSKPGRGFFSNINSDYFKGELHVENVPSYGDDETGIEINIHAEAMPNESQSKQIRLDVYNGKGEIVKSRRKTLVSGNHTSIGDNFYKEVLPNRNDQNGCTGIEITISSGNLFDLPTREVIFKQKYTIEDLRKIDDQRVVISNSRLKYENTIFEDSFEQMELENSESFHTIYHENEDLIEQIAAIEKDSDSDAQIYDHAYSNSEQEDEVDEAETVNTIARSPPPRNSYIHEHGRKNWMPVPYPSDFCIGCRTGYCRGCNYA